MIYSTSTSNNNKNRKIFQIKKCPKIRIINKNQERQPIPIENKMEEFMNIHFKDRFDNIKLRNSNNFLFSIKKYKKYKTEEESKRNKKSEIKLKWKGNYNENIKDIELFINVLNQNCEDQIPEDIVLEYLYYVNYSLNRAYYDIKYKTYSFIFFLIQEKYI